MRWMAWVISCANGWLDSERANSTSTLTPKILPTLDGSLRSMICGREDLVKQTCIEKRTITMYAATEVCVFDHCANCWVIPHEPTTEAISAYSDFRDIIHLCGVYDIHLMGRISRGGGALCEIEESTRVARREQFTPYQCNLSDPNPKSPARPAVA